MATWDEIKQAMVSRVITEGLVGPNGQPMPAMDSVLEAVTDGIMMVEGAGPHAATHITGGSDVIPDAVPGGASGLMSGADKAKLDGVEPGAQVNQNAFSYVKVGATTIEADSKTDTLEFAAGSNIALTPDAANDKVTIALTGTVPSALNADTVDSKHASDFALLGHGHTGGSDGNPIGTSGLQDGAVTDAKVGNRTADQAQTPTGSTGTLTQLFSWIANRLKAITGATNWFDAPAATLAAIWAKFNASTGHKHTGAADDAPQVDYANIANKPTSFTPSAHKSTHASGGSDTLTPGDIGAVSKAGDTMTGALVADRDVGPSDTRIYKNLASYKNSSANLTGTLKIALPKSWSNTMLRIRIVGYDYSSNSAYEVTVAGYNYASTPAWVNYSAELRGMAPFSTMRLGHDGTVCCILLGTTSTVWQYPHIVIEELIAGYSSVTGWESGWQISLITDESGITNIVTPSLRTYWHAGNDGSGSGSDSDLLDGQHASAFAPASHVGATGTAHGTATTSVAGFMSAADKTKLDGIAAGAEVNQNAFTSVKAVDSSGAAKGQVDADAKTDLLTFKEGTGISLSVDASTDTITIAATGGGLPAAHASTHITGGADVIPNAVAGGASGLMSGADKQKLDGIQAGAEVNQNAFSNVLVGGTTIAADSKTDTLELVAGTNIALTPDATNDRVTIAVSGTVASASNADTVDGKHASDLVLNAGSTPSIQAGADASKPAAGVAGRLYIATDTQIIYRDSGSAWVKVGVVTWGDIDGKPTSFTPSAHKSTHASGGSDALSPSDIGAETPSGAQAKVDSHAASIQTHGASGSYRLAKTSRTDQLPAWADIPDKPSTFTPSAHKSSHESGGSDAITNLANGSTVAGHTIWHAGNDGAGSGLDADLLDGYHASSFAVAPIPVTSLKTAQGSSSLASFNVHQYAFASPIVTAAGGYVRFLIGYSTATAVRQWLTYAPTATSWTITWDYLTASGRPRIWAVVDDAGNIVSMWEAEDPVDEEFPDECPIGLADEGGNSIIPVGGAVVPVQFPSEQQLVALKEILAKTPMPKFASRGIWANHKTPDGIVQTIFDREMRSRGLEPVPDVREALSVQDIDKRNWRIQLWLRAVSRVRKDHRAFTLIPLFEEIFRVDKRTGKLEFK